MDTQGDAFFYAFGDAPRRRPPRLQPRRRSTAGPVRVRMGLHTGTPARTAEGYVGLDVHLGARIAAAGHGGQVVLSACDARRSRRRACAIWASTG